VKWHVLFLLLLLLSACAPRQVVVEEPVTNPWTVRAESLAHSGVDAMGREQWDRARMLFERSLQAATLAGDERLVALAWYNIGRARASAGDDSAASQAFQQAIGQAEGAGDAVNSRRASLALALLSDTATPKGDDTMLDVPAVYPIDIHLAAARLAALRGYDARARAAYERVLDMAGKDRAGRLYAARAHLGLAELERVDNAPAAQQQLARVMDILHRAGQPRLMLQALMLVAELEDDPARRLQWQQRAERLRSALHTDRPPPASGKQETDNQ